MVNDRTWRILTGFTKPHKSSPCRHPVGHARQLFDIYLIYAILFRHVKYQIEYAPHQDVVIIHVNQRLIQGSILCFRMSDDSRHEKENLTKEAMNQEALINFCKTVSELDGMEEHILFNRYDIQLSKASMFSWDDLIPEILLALKMFVARDEQIEESAPPKRPTEECLEVFRKQGCSV